MSSLTNSTHTNNSNQNENNSLQLKQLLKVLYQAKDEQERLSKLALIRSSDTSEFVKNKNGLTILKIWLSDEKKKMSGLLCPLLELLLALPFDIESLKVSGIGKYVKAFDKSEHSLVRSLVERIRLKWKKMLESSLVHKKSFSNESEDSLLSNQSSKENLMESIASLSNIPSSSTIPAQGPRSENQKIPKEMVVEIQIPIYNKKIINEDKIFIPSMPPQPKSTAITNDHSSGVRDKDRKSSIDTFISTLPLHMNSTKNMINSDKSLRKSSSESDLSSSKTNNTTSTLFSKSANSNEVPSPRKIITPLDYSKIGPIKKRKMKITDLVPESSFSPGDTPALKSDDTKHADDQTDGVSTPTMSSAEVATPSILSFMEEENEPLAFSYKTEKQESNSEQDIDFESIDYPTVSYSKRKRGLEDLGDDDAKISNKNDDTDQYTNLYKKISEPGSPSFKKKKRVSFAPFKYLVKIKYFENTKEEREYRKMKISHGKDFERNEGKEAFSSRSIENDDDNCSTVNLITWHTPAHLASGYEYGTKSVEKDIQKAREQMTLAAVYYSDQHIPPSPYEPHDANNENLSQNITRIETKIIPLHDLASSATAAAAAVAAQLQASTSLLSNPVNPMISSTPFVSTNSTLPLSSQNFQSPIFPFTSSLQNAKSNFPHSSFPNTSSTVPNMVSTPYNDMNAVSNNVHLVSQHPIQTATTANPSTSIMSALNMLSQSVDFNQLSNLLSQSKRK